jgi:hypothetical protein
LGPRPLREVWKNGNFFWCLSRKDEKDLDSSFGVLPGKLPLLESQIINIYMTSTPAGGIDESNLRRVLPLIVSSNLCEIFEVGKIGANLPNWI